MKYAELEWNAEGTPFSPRFQDNYASRQGAMEESRYVFLQGNRLTERFAEAKQFTIGELGFGTGLNFALTWQLWEQQAQPPAQLSYVAVEKFPLHPKDIQRVAQNHPELAPYFDALIAQWPPPIPGVHCVHFAEGRVRLYLLYGNAEDILSDYEAQVDAWYLDGFAPARNPALWNDAIFAQIDRLSAPDASAATYSAARCARDGLQRAGFETERRDGFGAKRHMLVARRTGETRAHRITPTCVTVVGGGLAGASCAYALAQRGCKVTLIESTSQLATGASAQTAGVIFPQISKHWDARTELSLCGYLHTLRILQQFRAADHDIPHEQCGMLWIPLAERYRARLPGVCERLELPESLVRPVTREHASTLAGLPVHNGGLYFPDSGWVDMPALCRALTAHPNIQIEQRAITAKDITRCEEPVIIAAGYEARTLLADHSIPLTPLPGQMSLVPPNATSAQLQCILSYGGHASPVIDGVHHVGASFEHGSAVAEESAQAHADNLTKFQQCIGSVAEGLTATSAIVGVRTTTPDRMPLVGQVNTNLYASTGHGARGLTSCLLAGELLASHISGEAPPCRRSIATALSPQRF